MFSPLLLVLTYFGVTQTFYYSGRKIDCVVSEWSEWDGPLSFGEYERYRSVLVHPVNKGTACPELHETKSAGSPGTNAGVGVDCVVGEWGEWNGPLGFGEYERYRPILVQPVKAGKVCPETYEIKSNGSPGTNAGYNAGVRNSKYIQKEVFILTHGESNCGVNATQAAKELKDTIFSSADDKVKVYGLMIGFSSQRGREEMKSYVSNPPGQNFFAVSDFDDLLSVVAETKRLTTEGATRCVPIEVPPDPLVG